MVEEEVEGDGEAMQTDQTYFFYMLPFVGSALLLFLYGKYYMKDTKGYYFVFFPVCTSIFDIYTDLLLFIAILPSEYVELEIKICSLTFIVIPTLLNAICFIHTINIELEETKFNDWFFKHRVDL